MGHIYCLFSTRDGSPRYVGQCRGPLGEPFSRHKTYARSDPYTRVSAWIRAEWLAGYDVKIHDLERDVDGSSWIRTQRENFWMGQFPDLLNERKLYYIGKTLSALGAEHKQNCIDSIAHIIDHYNGYYGVRRQEYRALEYNGTDDNGTLVVVSVSFHVFVCCIIKKQLFWESLERWWDKYSDLHNALEGRDGLRQQLEDRFTIVRPRPWPPDRSQIAVVLDQ